MRRNSTDDSPKIRRIEVIWDGGHFHLEDRFGRVVDWYGNPMRVGVDGVWEPAPPELVADPRECVVCGVEFLPPRRDAVYCSHRCRQRAYRQRA
jgi:hypothetical protein